MLGAGKMLEVDNIGYTIIAPPNVIQGAVFNYEVGRGNGEGRGNGLLKLNTRPEKISS